MDEKLILKRPDSQQAIAPMNRYAIADKPERKRGRLVLSALFLGALGSVLGSKDGESEPANHDRDPEPVGSEPPGEALDMSGALEAIEDAAAYIQGLLADLAFPDEVMPAKLGRLRSSVRLAFDDSAPNTDLIDERPFKTGTRPANDNGLQGFDFPGLASSAARRPAEATAMMMTTMTAAVPAAAMTTTTMVVRAVPAVLVATTMMTTAVPAATGCLSSPGAMCSPTA
ncbi:hypothetical protein LAC79_32015 [Ensifer adhaerens]|uniref:hypothetical protein n=1 Tax=Ensifer adhaerens TaxID=106592 RepID=UPI001CCC3C81|nr:hypothetical protein [Ensifer adhaerens]MBZ7926401.1 hypothetical protein [Ensifer adhaerens]